MSLMVLAYLDCPV